MIRPSCALFLAAAPVQCGADEIRYADPADPAQALYENAGRLRERGDAAGAEETLRFLVERYPGSRFAERARMDLERRDAAP